MKHQLNVMNKLHNQQNHQNALEYQIMVDKLFNQIQHQLQPMMRKAIKSMMAVITKN
jgi:hypothetical protein